jgi:hypothetical protein
MKKTTFLKRIIIALLVCFAGSSLQAAQIINENFQSWTSKASYTTTTQSGSGGTWSYTDGIIAPTAAS